MEEAPAHQEEKDGAEEVEPGAGADQHDAHGKAGEFYEPGFYQEEKGAIPEPFMEVAGVLAVGAVQGALDEGHIAIKVDIERPEQVMGRTKTLEERDCQQSEKAD